MESISDSVLGRIRKLQRLSRSSNEHEAALAVAKMQGLLFAHNLSLEALRDPSEYVEEGREVGGRMWAQRLFASLCHNNFCQPLHGHPGYMVAVGRRENVAAVNEMFVYLVREIERIATIAYREYRRTDPWPEGVKAWKGAFRSGVVGAIHTRLQAQRERDIQKVSTSMVGTEAGTVVIRRLDLALQEEVARRYPNIRPASNRRRAWLVSSSGYEAGQAAGRDLSLTANHRLL